MKRDLINDWSFSELTMVAILNNMSDDLRLARFGCAEEGCNHSFSTKFNLRRHIETVHLKIKRFQCMTCGKFCVSKQVLNDHLNSHSGERPFVCEICGASYKHSSKLSFHRRKHKVNGELPSVVPRVARTDSSLPFRIHQIPIKRPFEDGNLELPPIISKTEYDEKLPSLEAIFKLFKAI